MWGRIKFWFVCRYIMNNMCHERATNRDLIFQAISESMYDTFYEDNFVTRITTLIEWILLNDRETVLWTQRPFDLSLVHAITDSVVSVRNQIQERKEAEEPKIVRFCKEIADSIASVRKQIQEKKEVKDTKDAFYARE